MKVVTLTFNGTMYVNRDDFVDISDPVMCQWSNILDQIREQFIPDLDQGQNMYPNVILIVQQVQDE